MHTAETRNVFCPNHTDASGVVSWVHIGDLHMTDPGQQNHLDLLAIVEEINQAFAGSIAFVFTPGDVADQGSMAQYQLVRSALDQLRVPWCSIIGDHDVHEKSFANYRAYMMHARHYGFAVGSTRFLALNAFDVPDPRSFTMQPEQLHWLNTELQHAASNAESVVLFLHCYPTDLKQGGEELRRLVASPRVRLVDMGHTHYNEIANDGHTLYTATRSTGQIEEGPAGFSVTNVDREVISWRFFPLNKLPKLMITSPSDERFITDATLEGHIVSGAMQVRAMAWGRAPFQRVFARCKGHKVELVQLANSRLWQGELRLSNTADGVHDLAVEAQNTEGQSATDSIRVVVGASTCKAVVRADRDQDNTIGAWPERGLLGTQLGPNKNGRKW